MSKTKAHIERVRAEFEIWIQSDPFFGGNGILDLRRDDDGFGYFFMEVQSAWLSALKFAAPPEPVKECRWIETNKSLRKARSDCGRAFELHPSFSGFSFSHCCHCGKKLRFVELEVKNNENE